METIAALPELYYRSLYKERAGYHRELIAPVLYRIGSGALLLIPAGYKTDGATLPRLLWAVISPYGRHDLATLVHDYLLTDTACSRRSADREMLRALRLSQVHPVKAALMYAGVRFYAGWLRIRDLINILSTIF